MYVNNYPVKIEPWEVTKYIIILNFVHLIAMYTCLIRQHIYKYELSGLYKDWIQCKGSLTLEIDTIFVRVLNGSSPVRDKLLE